jgi:hypothetical protein
MKNVSPSKSGIAAAPQSSLPPISYHSIAGGLISQMAHMMRGNEVGKFAPPFRVVILNNQGGVVFSGEVGRNGKLRSSGPLCRVRRSHFPANAMVTDGSFSTRTFRIARPAHRSA